jgi:hypothetical protein
LPDPDDGSKILEAKLRRQRQVIDAIEAATPEELEASAERIRAVMRSLKSAGRGRQRMAPPLDRNDPTAK